MFYICGVLVIGLLVPSNYPSLGLSSHNAAGSPFVIAIKRSGIKALPSIINACLLSEWLGVQREEKEILTAHPTASAWSAASSDLYTSSRALYGLAITRRAPAIFSRVNKRGVPWVAVLFCGMFGGLAYMSLQSTAGTVSVTVS